eukprot:TRINITY_DN47137_c0_g1_i1.p1 TRINITY_DN47137_c0_g1~~TRINITY_DN47137_c0_g1_i1.p1  ORF type:complete len:264 (+),score=130.28 TRINITY_DN47137_c0_g1_i1:38-829(+)
MLRRVMSSGIEAAKKKAAYAAVDEFVKLGRTKVIGVGSGSTVVYVVERLAQVLHGKVKLASDGGGEDESKAQSYAKQVVCIPTSFQATQLIEQHDLTSGNLGRYPVIDVAFDGADEVDSQLALIKGGGGCQTQEKIVASNANIFVVVADYRKEADTLGTKWTKGVPIEVIPSAYVPIRNRIQKIKGAKSVTLRMAKAKAGPVVTDNGNLLLDADFGAIEDPRALHKELIDIPGVVETGLFIDMAHKAFFGQEDGTVTTRVKKQ